MFEVLHVEEKLCSPVVLLLYIFFSLMHLY